MGEWILFQCKKLWTISVATCKFHHTPGIFYRLSIRFELTKEVPRFFIRSRFDPTLFWYHSVDDGGFIKASRTERTRFRVSIRPRGSGSAKDHQSDTENYDGKIMIGSDNVQISLASDDNQFVCAMGPDDDEVSKAMSAFDVAKRMLVQGETMSVVVRESFSASAAPNPSDTVDSEGKPDTVGDVESKQGILKVGKTPENFRFREILDGLFGMYLYSEQILFSLTTVCRRVGISVVLYLFQNTILPYNA